MDGSVRKKNLKISACTILYCDYCGNCYGSQHAFSIAVHLMAGLGLRVCVGLKEVTSKDLAKSVNTSASFIRRVLSKLSKAGLVEDEHGARPPRRWLLQGATASISLLDIYRAVDAPKAFSIHGHTEQKANVRSAAISKASTGEGAGHDAGKSHGGSPSGGVDQPGRELSGRAKIKNFALKLLPL